MNDKKLIQSPEGQSHAEIPKSGHIVSGEIEVLAAKLKTLLDEGNIDREVNQYAVGRGIDPLFIRSAVLPMLGPSYKEKLEQELIARLSDFDIPAIVRKDGDKGVDQAANMLKTLVENGFGDYVAIYNVFAGLLPSSRRDLLLLWQKKKKIILESAEKPSTSQEEVLQKHCTPNARKELEKILATDPNRYAQLLSDFQLKIALLAALRTNFTSSVNGFLGHRSGFEFDCDETTMIDRSLCATTGKTVYPCIFVQEHVCQDIPDTDLAYDIWGQIMTKNELIEKYESDYWVTEKEYATVRFTKKGKAKDYRRHPQHAACVQSTELLSSVLMLQADRFQDEKLANSAKAVEKISEKVSPDSKTTALRKAYVLRQEKKYDEAIAVVRTYLERMPEDSNAVEELASSLISKGDVKEGIEQYQAILAKRPFDTEKLYRACYALYKRKDFDAVFPLIDKYLPKSAEKATKAMFSHFVGLIHTEQKNYSAALSCMQEAVKNDPDNENYDNALKKVKRLMAGK